MSVALPRSRPRAVVADDSGFMRRLLVRALTDAGFEILGEAADGDEALRLCTRHRPDVLTLDLAMPGRDGIGVLRALGEMDLPTTVVVVSAFSPAHGVRAVDALAEGAFELVSKPSAGEAVHDFLKQLGAKAGAAARAASRAATKPAAVPPAPPIRTPQRPEATRRPGRRITDRPSASRALDPVVVIACSTGGPRALASLMPALPPTLGAGTLIVQHMPEGFTEPLAARLDRASDLSVREARNGDTLDPCAALMAPGGSHLRLRGQTGIVRLSDEAPIGALRPRADLTIADAARAFGRRVLLVVLTGMGSDGLDGARAVRAAGGRVIVEAESTCVVYGMPRAVAEADLADDVLPLPQLPTAITEACAA